MGDLPLIQRLVQRPAQPEVTDPQAAVAGELDRIQLADRLRPGARVAIAVGSRGIANLVPIVRATVEYVRRAGAEPFIVAAMGSHGGATGEGQRALLAELGVREDTVGAPIRTEMEAECIGTNDHGLPVFWDRNALAADAVLTVSRIKPHTDFRSRYESGIVKMLVVGLGKRDGATQIHRYGARGLRTLLESSVRVILEKTPFLAGIALVENFYDRTALVQAVRREELLELEPKLLEQARRLMATLPFEELDVLVIGELGKNYSGCGIDPNVIGRMYIAGEPEFERPRIARIVVLELAPESHGNATGIGLADFITDRLLRAMERRPTEINAMVSTFVERARVPLSFPTDRDAIMAALQTCWQPEPSRVRLAIIPNTLQLAELWATPAACDQPLPDYVEIDRQPRPIPFDDGQNLVQEVLFPHSWRAYRAKGVLLTAGH